MRYVVVYGIEFNEMTLCDNESPWSNIKEKKFKKMPAFLKNQFHSICIFLYF